MILSRKGFDSTAGGVASPILPDGSLLSLPIPDPASPIRYDEVSLAGHAAGRLVAELTRGRVRPHHRAHLDPDLVASAYRRQPGWRALFGQAGQAQAVLQRDGVGPGDLFLFFGWFRRVEQRGGEWRFEPGAPDRHVLWGWLQVDRVIDLATAPVRAWATYHPHVAGVARRAGNTLYIARQRLHLGGHGGGAAGAGVFERYDDALCLTRPGAARSQWRLPGWFAPDEARRPLGYHGDLRRWRTVGDHVELRSVARGQEFVLDAASYPEVLPWAASLIVSCRGRTRRRRRP